MSAEKYIERVQKGFQLSKNVSVFLVCFSLALLFWLLKLFSNSYTTIIEFPVKYINFPINRVAVNYVPTSLAVKVEAYGYDLFTIGLFSHNDSIIIDGTYIEQKTSGGKTYSYVSTKTLLTKATSNIDSDVLIKELLMDTIPFHLEDKITKMVLVHLDMDITFEKQYAIKGELIMRPEAVQISGPKSLLDTINKLRTKPLVLNNVNDNISFTTELETNDSRVQLQHKNVLVTVEVEKFTESEKIIPIEFVNVPKGYIVKTFPSEIMVIYLVGLSEYESIAASQFRAIVDLDQLDTNPTKLQVQLVNYPKGIKINRHEPTSVEYVIRK